MSRPSPTMEPKPEDAEDGPSVNENDTDTELLA